MMAYFVFVVVVEFAIQEACRPTSGWPRCGRLIVIPRENACLTADNGISIRTRSGDRKLRVQIEGRKLVEPRIGHAITAITTLGILAILTLLLKP